MISAELLIIGLVLTWLGGAGLGLAIGYKLGFERARKGKP